MTYAIAQTSGKQFLFRPGCWYDIDFIGSKKNETLITFRKLLCFKNEKGAQIGTPFLSGGCISAWLAQEIKSSKVIVLKTKPKKNYTRTKGHRQKYSRIVIAN